MNDIAKAIGSQAAQPTSGSITLTANQVEFPFFKLRFDLDAARIAVTDDGGNGSFGTLKLFDFNAGSLLYEICRQNYTAFAEGEDLTGEAGDAVFEIGVGSAAIAAAANGTLGATNDNIGADVDVTLSSGTGTGNDITAANLAINSATPTLNLNWSGTAATIDANSHIDVTGHIEVMGYFLGAD